MIEQGKINSQYLLTYQNKFDEEITLKDDIDFQIALKDFCAEKQNSLTITVKNRSDETGKFEANNKRKSYDQSEEVYNQKHLGQIFMNEMSQQFEDDLVERMVEKLDQNRHKNDLLMSPEDLNSLNNALNLMPQDKNSDLINFEKPEQKEQLIFGLTEQRIRQMVRHMFLNEIEGIIDKILNHQREYILNALDQSSKDATNFRHHQMKQQKSDDFAEKAKLNKIKQLMNQEEEKVFQSYNPPKKSIQNFKKPLDFQESQDKDFEQAIYDESNTEEFIKFVDLGGIVENLKEIGQFMGEQTYISNPVNMVFQPFCSFIRDKKQKNDIMLGLFKRDILDSFDQKDYSDQIRKLASIAYQSHSELIVHVEEKVEIQILLRNDTKKLEWPENVLLEKSGSKKVDLIKPLQISRKLEPQGVMQLEIQIQVNKRAKSNMRYRFKLNLRDKDTKELFGEQLKIKLMVVEDLKSKFKKEKVHKSVVKIHDVIENM
ncbi:UNKNOWN [Stylonychia lemnae]|uniref:Uncharacterized protein n=1 Tax=Stylonychia lemnae TaxID=5949 RepID=A0A078AGE7_STYLE|nr:UNKNOWN [Stylonychia lemnae]|eukprot:CDW79908.1 UNKNOWN [Stylonychia lemnae]